MSSAAVALLGLSGILFTPACIALAHDGGKPRGNGEAFNLVLDGGFERPKGSEWSFGWSQRFEVVSPGRSGKHCLRLALPKPGWTFADQMAALPAGAKKIRARCSARLRDVVLRLPPHVEAEHQKKGEDPTKLRGAKLFTLFHDAFRERIGGWPGVKIGTGTRDWKAYEATLDVPAGARMLKVAVGLEHAGGTVWFDDVHVEALDASGRPLPGAREIRTDTRDWWAFRPPPFDPRAKSVFDACPLNDAPAGRRGFATARGGRLAFADGTRARFWGVNLIADGCFPGRRTAEGLAACLSRFGCNLVRLCFLDAPARWWGKTIFAAGDDTRRLDPTRLDELCCLLAQLKRRGIYVHVELLTRREFRKNDGVRDYDKLYADVGLSPALFFNPRLIELQKEFARQLLTHRNPYTQLRLCDDPAVALVSLMNENTMFLIRRPLLVDRHLAPSYQQELTRMWNGWLRGRYKQRAKLAAAWGKALRDREKWDDSSVALSDSFRDEGLRNWRGPRLRDSLAFLRDVERGYLREMRAYLRGIGVRAPVSGSSRAAESGQAVMDYVDEHTYWDHPAGGWGWRQPIRNVSILAGKAGRDHLTSLFAGRVAGKPYLVTEWAFCWPNEFRCEAPVVLAACGAAQDLDGFCLYGFGARGGGDGPYDLNWRSRLDSAFRLRGQPTVFCQWPVAHMLFVRGDVGPFRHEYVFQTSYDEAWQEAARKTPEPPTPNELFQKGRVGKRYVSGAAGQPNVAILELETDPQLFWRGRTMFVNSPRTQGAVGFFAGSPAALKDVRIETTTEFCSLTVASLTGEPIARSRRLLLTGAARAENTAAAYAQARTRLRELGRPPILIEPVRADITVRTPWSSWTLTPLDAHGCPRAGAGRTIRRSRGRIPVRIGTDRCLWYDLAAAAR